MLDYHKNGRYWFEDEGWEYCPDNCEECAKEKGEKVKKEKDPYDYQGGKFDKLRDENGI